MIAKCIFLLDPLQYRLQCLLGILQPLPTCALVGRPTKHHPQNQYNFHSFGPLVVCH